jgi:hypothetical protein
MKKVDVLVFGMRHEQNPITRALSRYQEVNVKFMPANEDGRAANLVKIPLLKALILATGHIGHHEYWGVRDLYKRNNIPIFKTGAGFSHIKEDFEKWLDTNVAPPERKDPVIRIPAKTALQVAFEQAKQIGVTPVETPVVVEHTMSNRQQAEKVAYDCVAAGLTVDETGEMLKAEGLTDSNGNAFTYGNIHNLRSLAKKKLKAEGVAIPPRKLKADLVQDAVVAAQPVRTKVPRASSAMELIGQIMDSKALAMERKLELIARVRSGEFTESECVSVVRTGDTLQVQMLSIFSNSPRVLAKLDKVQAIAFLKILPEIRAFANEGIE